VPKINVYVPDELADAIKDSGLPVSAVCQRALEQAVRRMTALRRAIDTDDFSFDNLTPRAGQIIRLAVERARAAGAPSVSSGHIALGILDEGANLALRVLAVEEVPLDSLRQALEQRDLTEPPAAEPSAEALRMSPAAMLVLELAVSEALALGHNYVGAEHFLLGLVAEPDGSGGQVLRSFGLEPRGARKAVAAALVGYAHLRATGPTVPAADPMAAFSALLQPLVERIERLEARQSA
jgi:ATP-dependent Clp protease ATP-binding subunit ClpA